MILDALERRSSLENPSTNVWGGLMEIIQAQETRSRVRVDEESARRNTTVFSCIRKRATTLAMLPCHVREPAPEGGSRTAREDPLDRVVHRHPNPEMIPQVFYETGQSHIDGHGDFYAEVQRTRGGAPFAIWPLRPDRTRPLRKAGRKVLLTYVKRRPGATTLEPRHLRPGNYIHIPGFSRDGFKGYSIIGLARETIGAAIAREEFQARFFANGAKLSAVFKHPGKLSDPAYRRLKADLRTSHEGLENAHRIALLEEGMDVETIGIPMTDAQFIEQIRLGDLAICRLFDVPPHKVGILDNASFSNITEQNLEWATQVVAPMAVRWEQTLGGFVSSSEREVRFNIDALHRADIKTRMEAHGVAVQWGIRTRDEIRALEELGPLTLGQGGDETWMPQTHAPAAKIIATPIEGRPASRSEDESTEDQIRALRLTVQPLVADVVARGMRRFEAALERRTNRGARPVDREGLVSLSRRDLEPVFLHWSHLVRDAVTDRGWIDLGIDERAFVDQWLGTVEEGAAIRAIDPEDERSALDRASAELQSFAEALCARIDQQEAA